MQGRDHIGRSVTAHDVVRAADVSAFAATLSRTDIVPDAGGELPLLWHWMLFQDWQPTDRLGTDGHPARGGFLPAFAELPRRMWAGGALTFHAPLRIGDSVSRVTEIVAVDEKIGASGPLAFVTLRHLVSGPAGLAIEETQQIVYRGRGGPDGAASAPSPPPPPPGASGVDVACDPVLLFRYSAVTGNSHRIHYDERFAREAEGYPALLVHLPLQVTLLAALLPRIAPDAAIVGLSYRGRRPAFCGRTLQTHGWSDGGTVTLQTRDPEGHICVSADARLDPATATGGS